MNLVKIQTTLIADYAVFFLTAFYLLTMTFGAACQSSLAIMPENPPLFQEDLYCCQI